jgi:hypothetical protein
MAMLRLDSMGSLGSMGMLPHHAVLCPMKHWPRWERPGPPQQGTLAQPNPGATRNASAAKNAGAAGAASPSHFSTACQAAQRSHCWVWLALEAAQ